MPVAKTIILRPGLSAIGDRGKAMSFRSPAPGLTATEVQFKKEHKIDFSADYPCPCPRQGRLIPIALTEAFGCDRCQQMFVLQEQGYVLEQLPTHDPYPRSWRWNGHRWQIAHANLRENYLAVAILVILMLLVIWLPLALRLPRSANIIPWVILAVLLAILPALMVWLAYRR